jgi:integrase
MTFTSAPLALRSVENVCRKVVTRSIYRSVVGKCKTEASRKPVPLDPWVAEELLIWRTSAPYNQPDDWIFGSPRTKGQRPYQPDMILQRGIVPPQSRQGLPNTSAGT